MAKARKETARKVKVETDVQVRISEQRVHVSIELGDARGTISVTTGDGTTFGLEVTDGMLHIGSPGEELVAIGGGGASRLQILPMKEKK